MRRSLVIFAIAMVLPASAWAQGSWHVYHGTVQAVQGTTMTLRADDGKTFTFDLTKVRPDLRQLVVQGEALTVVGWPAGQDQFTAHLVQPDRPLPWQVSSTAGWQRIHGQVQSVRGSNLTFRADDGRTLTVDMSEVSPNVQKALTPNEGATIVGFAGPDANRFRARYIQLRSVQAAGGLAQAAMTTR